VLSAPPGPVHLEAVALGRLLLAITGFSVVCEALQYLLAIGTTDLTDVVTNTLGGLTGLLIHRLVARVVPVKVLDGVITVLGLTLFTAFLLLRLLVFRVRHQGVRPRAGRCRHCVRTGPRRLDRRGGQPDHPVLQMVE
jgi:hypothetical protein